jgi:hypothetical protein
LRKVFEDISEFGLFHSFLLEGGVFGVILNARSTHRIDANQPGFLLGVERKITPWLVAGVSDELSHNGVHMDVVKLLDAGGFELQTP